MLFRLCYFQPRHFTECLLVPQPDGQTKTIASISGLAVSGIVGIIMACLGCSYWSIATQSIVYISVLNICLWSFSPWRPTLKFSFKPLKGMVNFSAKLMITNIFNHINNNLFSII